MSNIVSASILAADVLNFEKTVRLLEKAKVDMLHFDVMDGIFVSQITYGECFLKAMKKITSITMDVHLMTQNPYNQIESFAAAGADIISFHAESGSDIAETAKLIHRCGVKCALAVKPGTEIESIYPYLELLDTVLVMTVEPGKGGQPFLYEMTEKIEKIKKYADENKFDISIQVDGGINRSTAVNAVRAGADNLVAGTFLFMSDDMPATVELLKKTA